MYAKLHMCSRSHFGLGVRRITSLNARHTGPLDVLGNDCGTIIIWPVRLNMHNVKHGTDFNIVAQPHVVPHLNSTSGLFKVNMLH